jgi:hypothetical protein
MVRIDFRWKFIFNLFIKIFCLFFSSLS